LKTSIKCDYGNESYSTTGIPKNVSNSSSITGVSIMVFPKFPDWLFGTRTANGTALCY
jgi:hypothetical protein